jgi:hypothetical protein
VFRFILNIFNCGGKIMADVNNGDDRMFTNWIYTAPALEVIFCYMLRLYIELTIIGLTVLAMLLNKANRDGLFLCFRKSILRPDILVAGMKCHTTGYQIANGHYQTYSIG